LFYLSKAAFKRHLVDDLWQVKADTSANSLGVVITSDTIVDQIRKELRRQTGHNVEPRSDSPGNSSTAGLHATRPSARRLLTVRCPKTLGETRHHLQREHRRLLDKGKETVPIDHR
jgi:hypothetical protein